MIRTGYSFGCAVGHLGEVSSRLVETGSSVAPISDRCSTFGFVKWTKAARKANLRPVYGVELAVVPELGLPKPIIDHVRFLAIDNVADLNESIKLATNHTGKEPSLLYEEATQAKGLIKIFGERARLERFSPCEGVFIGLSPAVSKGFYNAAKKAGHKFVAVDSNFYPRATDQETYRIMLGQRAETRTYPSHILSQDEWRKAVSYVAGPEDIEAAWNNKKAVLDLCVAKLKTAEIFIPQKEFTLRELCEKGAQRMKVDILNDVYAQRLDRELKLIADKEYEDYFYIIADLIAFAKKRMIVGPARGSSCGSLVCYLLGITTIDPIPYNLIFERFIDVNRIDLPDIDIDFSDSRRHLVFEYAEEKYGKDHVARLGTVMMFQPTSSLKRAGLSLRIPLARIAGTLDGIIERSSGDARANNSLEDTLKETPAGKKLIEDFPEIVVAGRMEGHPNTSGQHAAGIVITKEPISDVVAIDSRTGATMCDKYDAEEYKLLKIDALGLTQLSIIERTLELIGEEDTSDGGYLDRIPLDDPLAFEVINNQRWPGIFQYNGSALQSLAKQFKSDNIEDIIAVTALARPGPLASGGANEWVRRRNGTSPVTYIHPLFEPHLKTSLGITIYQEQIMEIGREVGDLSWEDVTSIRKAMSKSLGKEFFDQYGEKWKPNAIRKGIPEHTVDKAWDDMCTFGSWCLSGDSVLLNPYPNQSHRAKAFTIKELHDAKGAFNKQRPDKKQKLYCLQKSTIEPAEIVDVVYSGKRETWLVEVDSGEKIRSTMDHRFLCSDGEYRQLKKLESGAAIMMIGKKKPTRRKPAGRGAHNHWNYKGQPPRVAHITSISSPKIEDVFDVSMPAPYHNFVADGFVVHNCFNRSHAVAYGMISYYCCYLKAHYPLEFAAATLDAETAPEKQLAFLRELKAEGISYVPVDAQHSTDRWVVARKDNSAHLVGPLGAIKGIGPKGVNEIMDCRKTGKPIRPGLIKKLANAKTELDSLYPIADAVKFLRKNQEVKISSEVLPIKEVQCGVEGAVVVIAVATRIAPRDENDIQNVKKRGRAVSGPHMSLNLFFRDDSDEIFCKIDRRKFDKLAPEIIERGKAGKAIYAIKGTVPPEFRMISVDRIIYLGDLGSRQEEIKGEVN